MTGTMFAQFESVYASGVAAGVAIGARQAREDVLQYLEDRYTALPLVSLNGPDLIELLGDRDRADCLRRHIDQAHERWWRREEQLQQRLDEAREKWRRRRLELGRRRWKKRRMITPSIRTAEVSA